MLTPRWNSSPCGLGGLSYQAFSVLVCEVDLYPSDKRLGQLETIVVTYITMACVFGAEGNSIILEYLNTLTMFSARKDGPRAWTVHPRREPSRLCTYFGPPFRASFEP